MESKNISFSVVMTCYNLEKYMAEAIESVLRQRYDGEKELIIVDDCSTDGSMQVIRQTLARGTNGWQATVIQTERNAGVAGACDAGWARARHEWIIMADGDDIQDERRLELTNNLVQRHPDAVMLVGSASYADINGNVYGYVGCCGMPYEKSPECSLLNTPKERLENYLLPDGPPRWAPFGCYMAIRRSVFMRWGELAKSAGGERIFQDPTWYLRALLTGPLLNSREPLCKYRTRENNILNRMHDSSTLEGCYASERHMTNFYRMNVKNYRQELRDIARAMNDTTLTDLTTGDLQQLKAHVSAKLAAYEILAGWWEMPWGKGSALPCTTRCPPTLFAGPCRVCCRSMCTCSCAGRAGKCRVDGGIQLLQRCGSFEMTVRSTRCAGAPVLRGSIPLPADEKAHPRRVRFIKRREWDYDMP